MRAPKRTQIVKLFIIDGRGGRWREKSPLLREGVDIQTAASRIAGVNGKRFRLAETENIVKDTFDALLMEFVMVAERNQIAQELLAVDFRPRYWICTEPQSG